MAGDSRLEGKVAIVAGAGSRGAGIGNGRATAVLLARHGAKIAIVDSNPDWAEETARLVAAEGSSFQIFDGDVGDAATCEAIVERTVGEFGQLDVLVNNISSPYARGDVTGVDVGAWDNAMSVKIAAMMLMSKYTIPAMMRSGGGSIINVTLAADPHSNSGAIHPTSRAAIIGLTHAMAAHHIGSNIRVNCIVPGWVDTSVDVLHRVKREIRAASGASKAFAESPTWDLDGTVLFLASDDARWITGAALPIESDSSAGRSNLPVAPSEQPKH